LSVLTYTYLYYSVLHLSSSVLPLPSSSIPIPIIWSISSVIPIPQYSFYTCRYLHILIYIPSSFPDVLTPHKLSEGCLEWCSFICVVFGSGGMVFDIRCLCYYILYIIILLYIYYYIILLYYILYYTLPLLFPILLSLPSSPNIWPRTFYRSGWLRCVVVICIRFMFWAGGWLLWFELVLYYILYYYYTYYIILLYIHYYIISYLILYSPLLLFFSSIPHLFPILFLSSIPFPLQFNPYPSSSIHSSVIHIPIFILYLSVLTYTYLYSSSFPIFKNNLTPHVLSEWMVEVCRFY
jgi:hypothetical protein